MVTVSSTKTYRCTLVAKGMVNKSDIQLFTYNYLQFLKKLGAVDITAFNKKSYQLAYPIQKINNVTFIEFAFTISPKALDELKRKIKFDDVVLRSFLVKN